MSRNSQHSPYKTAKFRQHVRSRSRSPNRSFSNSQVSHNNSTIHSEYLWNTLDEIQLFPPICVEMLKHEQRNLCQYKKSINREKNRINSEMQTVSVQINHILEDFRLSLLAIMDKNYQNYISKYAEFKSELMEIIRLKDQIEGQFIVKQQTRQARSKNSSISNQQTIKSMEISHTQLKRFQIINYIAELQKDKILPITEKAEYLFINTEYDNGFFQPQQFKNITNSVKLGFRANFHQILNQSYAFIRDPDNIVFKQQMKNKQNTQIFEVQRDIPPQPPSPRATMLEQNIKNSKINSYPSIRNPQLSQNLLGPRQQTIQTFREPSQNPYGRMQQKISPPQSRPVFNQPIIQQQSQMRDNSRSHPYLYDHDSQIQQMQTENNSFHYARQKVPPISFRNEMPYSESNRRVSEVKTIPQIHSQHYHTHPQVIVANYRVSPDLIRISQQNPFSFKSKSMDVILCCLYIDQNLIAVGSKDGSLYFYDRNGNVVKAQQNVHKSPVCTLQLINDGQYLASGSDHPNPQIILWNLSSYELEPFCRLRQHKGAVTAIQCLQDNEHMISGSYDKRLCVYSIHERKLKYTLPSNKSSVTALTLNSNGSKLISCCLENNALNIWQIVRNANLDGVSKVQTIFLQQVVQSNTMICSVVSSAAKPNLLFLGTKDGRLKIVDIDRGEAVKNMNCCNNALIQMLVIEQAEGLPLILCWPCKERCFKVVDCESGKVINVSTRGQLDFSCGVGPKASAMKDGSGFVVCSQSDDREVYWYKINRAI